MRSIDALRSGTNNKGPILASNARYGGRNQKAADVRM